MADAIRGGSSDLCSAGRSGVNIAACHPSSAPKTNRTTQLTAGTMDPSSIYDRAFFDMHVPWQAEYDAIALLLARTLEFSSVLDLGCGNGFIISKLAEMGRTV